MEMAASSGESDLSLAKEISRLIKRDGSSNSTAMNNDEDEKNFTDAKHVNVFQLKAVDGFAHNGEYFLSDGMMTDDDLISQLTLVIIGYESINVNIYGICLDAGGSNASCVNALQHQKTVPAGCWLPEDCIWLKNPSDPSHWVYIIMCSVHNHKNG
jgi:hypothetical protein